MAVKNYKDLIAWQRAMDLVEEVYQATDCFPQREVFGLTNQTRRAAVSVPCNIAEGQGRATVRDFLHFLAVAKGSLQELETQVLIADRLRYLNESSLTALLNRTSEVIRILNGLRASLDNS
jgi:four helix bundle protein